MGYLNEFPHFESNKLNLDWLLEQYSTFNDRLQEITDAFNEAVNQFESDLENYETSINNAVASFENTVNGIIRDFKTETNGEIATFEATVEREIEQLTTNMITYVGEHMEEWQAENIYKDFVIDNNNWTTATTEDITAPDTFTNLRALVGNPNYKFVLKYAVEGVMTHLCELNCIEESSSLIVFVGHFYDYQIRLTYNSSDVVNLYEVKPTTFLTKNSYTGLAVDATDFDANGVLKNDSGYTLNKGTWLVIGHAYILPIGGSTVTFQNELDVESNITEIIKATTRGEIEAGTTQSEFTFAGVYSSTGTNNIKIRPKLLIEDMAPAVGNFASYTINLEFIKI